MSSYSHSPARFIRSGDVAVIDIKYRGKPYQLLVNRAGHWLLQGDGTATRGTVQYGALAYARGDHSKKTIEVADEAFRLTGIWAYSKPSSQWGLADNPPAATGSWLIGFAALAALGGWFLISRKASASTCPILEDKIDAWGKAKDLYVMWLFTATAPPAWAELKTQYLDKEWPEGGPTPLDTVVITHPNATFWSYNNPTQTPVVTPEAKASYCAF
jgi:hypothetical protein